MTVTGSTPPRVTFCGSGGMESTAGLELPYPRNFPGQYSGTSLLGGGSNERVTGYRYKHLKPASTLSYSLAMRFGDKLKPRSQMLYDRVTMVYDNICADIVQQSYGNRMSFSCRTTKTEKLRLSYEEN